MFFFKKINQYNSILFTDEVLKYIINTKTTNEKGVRSLKRNLEIIFNKMKLYSILGDNNTLFNETIIKNIIFPITLNNEMVDILIQHKCEIPTNQFMD